MHYNKLFGTDKNIQNIARIGYRIFLISLKNRCEIFFFLKLYNVLINAPNIIEVLCTQQEPQDFNIFHTSSF